jgi:hypothetical protein
VSGELQGPEAQAVQRAQHAEVAVEVEAALQVQYRGQLPGRVDAGDVGTGQGQLDLVAVALELVVGGGEKAQHLAGLVA